MMDFLQSAGGVIGFFDTVFAGARATFCCRALQTCRDAAKAKTDGKDGITANGRKIKKIKKLAASNLQFVPAGSIL